MIWQHVAKSLEHTKEYRLLLLSLIFCKLLQYKEKHTKAKNSLLINMFIAMFRSEL